MNESRFAYIASVATPRVVFGLADACGLWVSVDVTQGCQEALIGIDGLAPETPLEHMSDAAGYFAKVKRISLVHALHKDAQVIFWVFDKEMNMIVHQTVRMDVDRDVVNGGRHDAEETCSVCIAFEDDLPAITFDDSVIEPGFALSSGRVWHKVCLSLEREAYGIARNA